MGLTLYPEGNLDGFDVEIGFDKRFLQVSVIGLWIPDTLGLGHIHASTFTVPFVERSFGEAPWLQAF